MSIKQTHQPPSCDTVLDILVQLPLWTTGTVFHLITPDDVMVGPDVWDDHEGWHWRGSTLAVDGVCSRQQLIDDVTAWVEANRRPGDTWSVLDPEDPSTWVKSRRSGTRRLFFGMSFLGASFLSCDPGIPGWVAHYVAGQLVVGAIAAPAVVDTEGVSCILDGSAEAKHLLLAGTAPLEEEPW